MEIASVHQVTTQSYLGRGQGCGGYCDVKEDIGAVIISLKCHIKILETAMINNKTRKSRANKTTVVITTGIHHNLFATVVMALAISNKVVHIQSKKFFTGSEFK